MRRRPDVPFAPRRVPIFYGWVIVVVATLGTLMSIPGQTMGVSVFTDALLQATGLDRWTVSNAYLVGTLASGLTLPFAGSLLDRFGARPTAATASAVLAATLVGLSQVDRLARSLSLTALGTALLLTLGFYALRLAGQGMLTMVSRTLIGRWFDRRRGLASGLSGVFVGFGFGWAPQVLDAWIGRSGWRGAWQQLAGVVLFGMGFVALVFFRDDPESCGLAMDGPKDPQPPGDGSGRSGSPGDGRARGELDRAPEPEATRGEALRTAAFWAVSLGLATHSLVLTGVTFHIVDLGASAGLDRAASVELFLPLAVVSTAFGLVGGLAGDRLPLRALLALLTLGTAVGLFGAVDLASRSGVAVAGFGVASGLFGPLSTIAFPRLFGRRHLGAIVGAEMMCLVVASALGPSILAASRQLTGEYAAALRACLLLPAGVLVLASVARMRPRVK